MHLNTSSWYSRSVSKCSLNELEVNLVLHLVHELTSTGSCHFHFLRVCKVNIHEQGPWGLCSFIKQKTALWNGRQIMHSEACVLIKVWMTFSRCNPSSHHLLQSLPEHSVTTPVIYWFGLARGWHTELKFQFSGLTVDVIRCKQKQFFFPLNRC